MKQIKEIEMSLIKKEMDAITESLKKLLSIVVLFFIKSYILMLLWNWLMPLIFGLITLTFWQAVGVSILTIMLFNKSKYISEFILKNKKI